MSIEIVVEGSAVPAIVSEQDADLVLRFDWKLGNSGYPVTCGVMPMHRMIMGKTPDHLKQDVRLGYKPVVDHIDANKLNNQRENLRWTTHKANLQRSLNLRRQSSSGYRCVFLREPDKRDAPWMACLHKDGQLLFKSYFTRAADAAWEIDKVIRKHFDEHAFVNFTSESDYLVARDAEPEHQREKLTIGTVRHRATKRERNSSSKHFANYRGVVRVDRKSRPFQAKIWLDGKQKSLGTFATEIEAAKAYDAKAREIFGSHAITNFPQEDMK